MIVYPMEPIRAHVTSLKCKKINSSNLVKTKSELVLVVHLIGQEGDFPLVFSMLFHLR